LSGFGFLRDEEFLFLLCLPKIFADESIIVPLNPMKRIPMENVTGQDGEQWSTIIRPQNLWFQLELGELWAYRDLIQLFVRRNFIAQYKQTILGPVWFILQPFFTTLVFTIIFGKIAKIPTDGLPQFMFYFSGTICWGYFAECLNQTSQTFLSNASIYSKVYFPRLVVPIAMVISFAFKFFIQFIIFLIFLFYYYQQGAPVHPNLGVLALPLILIQMALLGIGFGIIVSSLTTKYRDLMLVVTFGVQLWMYATPVVYPLSQIPDKYRPYFALNPMTSVVEGFRSGFLGAGSLSLPYYLSGVLITLAVCFVGVVLFNRVEKTFVDTI
jgi:lipopolysaccharide transport system permease protein